MQEIKDFERTWADERLPIYGFTMSLNHTRTHTHTRMNAHIHSVLKLSKSIHFFAYTSCLTLACLYLHIISSFDVKGNAGFTCAAYVYLCACVPPFMYVHLWVCRQYVCVCVCVCVLSQCNWLWCFIPFEAVYAAWLKFDETSASKWTQLGISRDALRKIYQVCVSVWVYVCLPHCQNFAPTRAKLNTVCLLACNREHTCSPGCLRYKCVCMCLVDEPIGYMVCLSVFVCVDGGNESVWDWHVIIRVSAQWYSAGSFILWLSSLRTPPGLHYPES